MRQDRRCAMQARTWAVAIFLGGALLAVAADEGRAQVSGNAGKPAAVVNGEPISMAELDAAVKIMSGPTAVQVPESRRRQMRQDALAILMDNLLVQQFLRQNGPHIDVNEINKYVAELETALKKENKKLTDYLTENCMSEAQLRAQVTTALQWREYTKSRITDADVQQYYRENKDFFDGVQVRASHILIRVPLNGTDADVQAARTKLQTIRQDVEAGKMTFADAAKKH